MIMNGKIRILTVLLVVGQATAVLCCEHDKTETNTRRGSVEMASQDLLRTLTTDKRQHYDQQRFNKRVEPLTKRKFRPLREILSNGKLTDKAQHNCFDEKLVELEADIVELKSSLKQILAIHQNKPEKRTWQSESQVAFYAQLTQDLGMMGNHQTVVFDHVVTNIGNAYNKFSGMFTAPVSGTYVIFWATFNPDRTHFLSELVHNGNVVGQAWSDAASHDDGAMGSNQAVLQMNAGDVAYIRQGTNPWAETSTGHSITSFSGWLLYPA